jgi:DNA-binding transcriptional regulator PaaX
MSIIDKVLIAVDDGPQSKLSLEQTFPEAKTSVLYSAIGRLEGKGLIISKGRGNKKVFETSKSGAATIKNILSVLRRTIEGKSSSWLLIMVSLPEAYKVERERIRFYLKKRGFGLIRSGVFLGRAQDESGLKKEIDTLHQNAEIYYFSLNKLPDEMVTNAHKIWDASKIKNNYAAWLKQVNSFLSDLPKDTDIRRLQAKFLVFELAELIKYEPQIKTQDFSERIGRDKIIESYKKIRDYCYE